MKQKRYALLMWIVTALWVYVACLPPSSAQAAPSLRQVMIIFVDGFSFAEARHLQTLPQMRDYWPTAAYGAMSVRSPGPRTAENAYLLMGSGAPALYTSRSDTAYVWNETIPTGETAAERMRQLGEPVFSGKPADARIYFPGIHRLIADNQKKTYEEQIGRLGTLLAGNHMRLAHYGNADAGPEKRRSAVLFSMSRQGEVPEGEIGSAVLEKRNDYPFGVRTDYGKLLDYATGTQQAGLTVLELGDLARLYRMQPEMSAERFRYQYERTLDDIGTFVAQLLAKQTPDQLVLLLSSGVNPEAQKAKSLLLPIWMWQEGAQGGMLGSYTTRQPGLVSGLDVLPTVLEWLRIPVPKDVTGHVMREEGASSVSARDDWLLRLTSIDHVYRNRPAVMYGYVVLQMVAVLMAMTCWLLNKRHGHPLVSRLRRPIRIFLFSLLFYPALFLLEPYLPWRIAPSLVIGLLVLISLGIATAMARLGFLYAMIGASALTVAVILLDGFTGGWSISRSYLGYDPVIGARFYGLGNELEGVLIGSSILLAAAVLEAMRRRRTSMGRLAAEGFALSLFGVVLIYMALPSLGANAGGFLAGAVGFFVALLRFRGGPIRKTARHKRTLRRTGSKKMRSYLQGAGILALGILILIVTNLGSSYPVTHVGRVAQQIVDGEWTAVGQIVLRKLEMNLRLIRVSLWSKVFLVSLLAITVLAFRPGRFLRRFAQKRPCLVGGFHGVVAGSIAGLVLNDSGIISAATSIIFFVIPALYQALDEEGG